MISQSDNKRKTIRALKKQQQQTPLPKKNKKTNKNKSKKQKDNKKTKQKTNKQTAKKQTNKSKKKQQQQKKNQTAQISLEYVKCFLTIFFLPGRRPKDLKYLVFASLATLSLKLAVVRIYLAVICIFS